jgi:hypothetical protein
MAYPLLTEEEGEPCHVTTPHHDPGTLYGCYACESTCGCDESWGYRCIHCAALDLSNHHYVGG